jgi:VWFA-related protein
VFREINTASTPPAQPGVPVPASVPLPPGAVSNRLGSGGEPLSAATVVLLDQLNTSFELKEYQRTQIAKFLQSLGDHNRIALYSLGQSLHILQDFTDDPKKLMDAVAHGDSGNQVGFAQSDGPESTGQVEAAVLASQKYQITLEAMQVIARHMAGVAGRKSLVWVSQQFPLAGPTGLPGIRFLLGQANVALYPVLVRSLTGGSSIATSRRSIGTGPGATTLAMQDRNRRLGESLGGRGFNDTGDALSAVSAAEEDAKHYYVLGFYPAEAALDGATHQLTLDVAKTVSRRPEVTLQYRHVYLAAQRGAANQDQTATLNDLFSSPLESTQIGLTALIQPDPTRPGERQVHTSVDLAGINLNHEGERWTGKLQLGARVEARENGREEVKRTLTATLQVSLTETELEARRATGFTFDLPLPAGVKADTVHIIVQDTSTGESGSLRMPIPASPR